MVPKKQLHNELFIFVRMSKHSHRIGILQLRSLENKKKLYNQNNLTYDNKEYRI